MLSFCSLLLRLRSPTSRSSRMPLGTVCCSPRRERRSLSGGESHGARQWRHWRTCSLSRNGRCANPTPGTYSSLKVAPWSGVGTRGCRACPRRPGAPPPSGVAEQHGAVAEARQHRLLLLGGRLAAAAEEEVPGLPRHNKGRLPRRTTRLEKSGHQTGCTRTIGKCTRTANSTRKTNAAAPFGTTDDSRKDSDEPEPPIPR